MFNNHFPGIVDFIIARKMEVVVTTVAVNSAEVHSLLPPVYQHPTFRRPAAIPVPRPSVSALKAGITFHRIAHQELTWGSSNLVFDTKGSLLSWGELLSSVMPVLHVIALVKGNLNNFMIYCFYDLLFFYLHFLT